MTTALMTPTLPQLGGPVGSAAWWSELAELGTPLPTTLADGHVRLDFLYRGRPETRRVLINANGITDHHSLPPAELNRFDGTDAWGWSAVVRPDYRGSYCFIPLTDPALGDPPQGEHEHRSAEHRQWWQALLQHAEADETNAYRSHTSSWGSPLSPIHLADAPAQPAWTIADQGKASEPDVHRLDWTSPTLQNSRPVWLRQVGPVVPDQPMIILLDGRQWIERLALSSALDVAPSLGFPSCLMIMIDSLDVETRSRELPCHEPFWRAVQDELLPTVAKLTRFSDDPAKTVIAGQSYGGLAALYAGLSWPERFGKVLTQSGSFWWPDFAAAGNSDRSVSADGWLTKEVRGGLGRGAQLRIQQHVGRLEGSMNDVNEAMRSALEEAGHDVTYDVFEGGHEWLCWRGGLLDGITELLRPALRQAQDTGRQAQDTGRPAQNADTQTRNADRRGNQS